MIGNLDHDTFQMLTGAVMKQGNNWGCGVILHDTVTNKILLGERTDTHDYCSPGGKVEVGETVLNGMMRECLEESGLQLNSVMFLGYKVHTASNGKTWVSFMFYSSDFQGECVPQKSEIVSWTWLDLVAAADLKIFPPTNMTLELACQHKLIQPVDNLLGVQTELANGDGNGTTHVDSVNLTQIPIFEPNDLPRVSELYRHGRSEECCAYTCSDVYPSIWD